MKLVIGVDENLICEGFVRNFTEEEKDVLISAVRNGTPYEERQKDKWIIGETYDCHSDIVKTYTCPFCGKKEYSNYPYCHCGADMRSDV